MSWGWLPKHPQGSQIRARARAGGRGRGPLQHRQLFFQISEEGLNAIPQDWIERLALRELISEKATALFDFSNT